MNPKILHTDVTSRKVLRTFADRKVLLLLNEELHDSAIPEYELLRKLYRGDADVQAE
jgi:hypothetical protein